MDSSTEPPSKLELLLRDSSPEEMKQAILETARLLRAMAEFKRTLERREKAKQAAKRNRDGL